MNEANSESALVRHKRDRESTASDNAPIQTSVFEKHGKRQKLAVEEAGEVIYRSVPITAEVIEILNDEQQKQTTSDRAELKKLKTAFDNGHDTHNTYDSHRGNNDHLRSPLSTSFGDDFAMSPHVSDHRVFVSAHERYYSVVYTELAKRNDNQLRDLIDDYMNTKDRIIIFSDDASVEGLAREPSHSNDGNTRHDEKCFDHLRYHHDHDDDNLRTGDKYVEERVRRSSPDYGPEASFVPQTKTFALNVVDVHDYDNTQDNDDQAHSQYRYDGDRSYRRNHDGDEEHYDDRYPQRELWHERDRRDSVHDCRDTQHGDWNEYDRNDYHHDHHHSRHEDWHEQKYHDSFHNHRHRQHEDWCEQNRRDSFYDHRQIGLEDWHDQNHRDSFHDLHHTEHEDWYERGRHGSVHDTNHTRHDRWQDRDRREYSGNHPVANDSWHYHDRDYDHDRHDEDDLVVQPRRNNDYDHQRREYSEGLYHENDYHHSDSLYAIDDDSRSVRLPSLSSTPRRSCSPVDSTNLPYLRMGHFPFHATRIFVPAPNNAALAIEHHEFAIQITSDLEDPNVTEFAAPRRPTICYDLARYIGRLLSKDLLSAVPLSNHQTQRDHCRDLVKVVLGYASREAQQDALWTLQQKRPYLRCGHNRLGLSAWKLEGEGKLQAGTANVKWAEREWRGYQAGLEEARVIEAAMDGVDL